MGNRSYVAVLGLILISIISRDGMLCAAEETDSQQVGQMLSDAKNLASLIKSDIATLSFFALSGGEWQTRDVMLKLYTERTNTLRSQATRLEAARKSGTRSQQIAVERILPLMEELATSAEAAIRSTKSNPNRASTSEYRQYLKLTSDLLEELSNMIGAGVDYAKTRDDLDRVAAKIGISPVP